MLLAISFIHSFVHSFINFDFLILKILVKEPLSVCVSDNTSVCVCVCVGVCEWVSEWVSEWEREIEHWWFCIFNRFNSRFVLMYRPKNPQKHQMRCRLSILVVFFHYLCFIWQSYMVKTVTDSVIELFGSKIPKNTQEMQIFRNQWYFLSLPLSDSELYGKITWE